MRIDKLFELQGDFFARYAEGFEDPELIKIGKKHNIGKLATQAQEAFSETQFGKPESIIQSMILVMSRSSMVSMFDKPKFRDGIGTLSPDERERLADAMFDLLHGDTEKGFNQFLEQLVALKLARWSAMSTIPFYYCPNVNWFIKPNTTKSILNYFEMDKELIYKPRPSYEFYRDYSAFLDELKGECDPRLSTNNAAFTGFLMMTIK